MLFPVKFIFIEMYIFWHMLVYSLNYIYIIFFPFNKKDCLQQLSTLFYLLKDVFNNGGIGTVKIAFW